MFLLYIFIASVFCLSVLLLAKFRELKKGTPTIVGRFLVKGDPILRTLAYRFQHLLNKHWEKTFFLFLVHIPGRIEAFFGRFKNRAHDYYHGVNAKVRDQRDFPDDHISPYMRSMTFRRDAGDVSQF